MKRIILLLVLVVFGMTGLLGQVGNQSIEIEQPVWEKVNTPHRGINLANFAEANGRMWTIDEGLVFSDDGGQTWERHPNVPENDIHQVFAGDFGVVYTRIAIEY